MGVCLNDLNRIFYQKVKYEGLTLSYFNNERIYNRMEKSPKQTTPTIPSFSDGVAKSIRSMEDMGDNSRAVNFLQKQEGHIQHLSIYELNELNEIFQLFKSGYFHVNIVH